jgi:hypothetical protein
VLDPDRDRVLDASGKGTDANIIDSIAWSVRHGAAVINLSFGRAEAAVPRLREPP